LIGYKINEKTKNVIIKIKANINPKDVIDFNFKKEKTPISYALGITNNLDKHILSGMKLIDFS